MQGIALTHDQLRAIATLAAFASRDEVTPVITGVQVSLEAGRVTAYATDRYRLAELSFPAHDTGDAFDGSEPVTAPENPVTIPAAFLARTVKMLPRRPLIPNATIALIVNDDATRVTLRDRLAGFDVAEATIRGNYPPVIKLFPENLEAVKPFDGPVRLNAAFLASLDKLSLPADVGARSIVKTYDMRTQAGDEYAPHKPKPVVFTRSSNDNAATLRAMIQPNMLNR